MRIYSDCGSARGSRVKADALLRAREGGLGRRGPNIYKRIVERRVPSVENIKVYTVDLVIFTCLDFGEFVILGLSRRLEFANYQFR